MMISYKLTSSKIHCMKLAICILILGITSCEQPKEKNKIFTWVSSKVKDDSCDWLSQDSNFAKPSYHAFFYDNYNKRINKHDINGAAILLNDVAIEYIQQKTPFDTITQIIYAFLSKYEYKVATEYAIAFNEMIALQFLKQGKYLKAITYLEKATSFTPSNYYGYLELGNVYFYLADCYLEVGKPDAAFTANKKSLECYEKTDFMNNISVLHYNISNLYLYALKYNEAIKSIDEALYLSKIDKKWSKYYFFLFSKADIYYESGNKRYYPIADSLYRYYKSNQNRKDINYKIDAYSIYVLKLIDEKKYTEAKSILDSIKTLYPKNIVEADLYVYYTTLSQYELAIGKPISSKNFLEDEIVGLYEEKNYNDILDNFELLRDDAKIRNDYKAAFNYQLKIQEAEDSLFSQIDEIQVLDLQIKYDTEKKEQQIVLQKSTLTKNRFQIIGLLASILAFSLGTILFFVYKKRKQAKLDIATQQQFTNDLMQNTEDERKRLATELHDSLSHDLLNLKNNIRQGKPAQEQDIEKIVQSIREISRNLYPAMFEQIGLVASIETLCERITNAGLFTTCEINYHNQLNKRNELQLYRIIQEALTNTAKHAKADAAKVTIDTRGSELYVEIIDNGVGFDANEKMKNSKSFGLQSIYQRARALGATSNMESNEHGTKLLLKTPLY